MMDEHWKRQAEELIQLLNSCSDQSIEKTLFHEEELAKVLGQATAENRHQAMRWLNMQKESPRSFAGVIETAKGLVIDANKG